ncbi:hypothetical protein GTY54_02100 [Streptomyces sp. SID625]|nr:hypothetical protein [Streptomyces sp. SID625]
MLDQRRSVAAPPPQRGRGHARLGEEYGRLRFALPFEVIHGDAHIGNVLRHRNGQAIPSDLDGFALAPREWDLVLTAIHFDRYGWHTRPQ